MVWLLLAKGANPNSTSTYIVRSFNIYNNRCTGRQTTLSYIVENGYIAVFEFLLTKGYKSMAKLLLAKEGVDLNVADTKMQRLLLWAAINRHKAIAFSLLTMVGSYEYPKDF